MVVAYVVTLYTCVAECLSSIAKLLDAVPGVRDALAGMTLCFTGALILSMALLVRDAPHGIEHCDFKPLERLCAVFWRPKQRRRRHVLEFLRQPQIHVFHLDYAGW